MQMAEFILRWDLRPCWVNGKKALFHSWGQPQAIVEYEDGTVGLVMPCEVKFADEMVSQYTYDDRRL